MINRNAELLAKFKEPSRRITGGVHVFTGDEIISNLLPNETLVNFEIEQSVPNNKFFGFVVSKKLTIELLGLNDIPKGTRLQPYVNPVDHTESILPYFYVETVELDEVNNKSIVTAYDILYQASKHTADEIVINYDSYGAYEYGAAAIRVFGGVPFPGSTDTDTYKNTVFQEDYTGFGDFWIDEDDPINLEGSETIREVLEALAEATGTICQVHWKDEIEFIVGIGYSSVTRDTLTPSDYFEFTNNEPVTLTKIAYATELGDNIVFGTEDGFTQVIWDNPFLTLRQDIVEHLTYILSFLSNKTLVPHSLKYRGNPAFELTDWLTIETPKGMTYKITLFNGVMRYDGGLSATSNMAVPVEENINSSPASIGQVFKQTYAKVDRINHEIELLASKIEESDTTALQEEIASIKLTTQSITQEVSRVESLVTDVDSEIDRVEGEVTRVETSTESAIAVLSTKVSNTLTANDVTILVEEELRNGAASVITETGYVFDKDGLTISKSGSEMETQITEDGMTVYRNGSAMLTANSTGVDAVNLHATTYLIVGDTTRFEDYNDPELGLRTGCFWIGR